MKTLILTLSVLLGLTISSPAQAQPDASPKNKKPVAKKTAAPDPALQEVVDDPKLPRVLIIGDSISMGYTVPVRNLLKGKANVHRPLENCSSTTNGLAKLDQWLGNGKWDAIHFNWGLHDLKWPTEDHQMIPPAAYEKNLRTLVTRMKATGAKLIWASTTPVPEGKQAPIRKTADVSIYNAVAKKVMDENQVATDDLYAFVLPRQTKIQRPVNVHYTVEGYKELAKPVAASIEAALAQKK